MGPVDLTYNHVLALERRVPELNQFGFKLTTSNAGAILGFYNSYLPLIRSESRGAYLRSALVKLRRAAPDLAGQVTVAIARSDLGDGIPDRAQILAHDFAQKDELAAQTRALEEAYGAKIITLSWGSPSRGRTLLYYFQQHPKVVVGKDVLHVAPEEELRGWLSGICRYKALDGSPDENSDIVCDVTRIPIADDSFDVVLCHRVLEHVVDDIQAMKEFYRVLRSGGILNVSVPQAAHRPTSAEWLVQDESHHFHVRHYGEDLTERLESAGFQVSLDSWLLERPRELLLAKNAYPLRMFNAKKSST